MIPHDGRSRPVPEPNFRYYSVAQFDRDRRRAWSDVISSLYAPLDIDMGDEDRFKSEIRRTSIGRLDLTHFTSDGQTVRRNGRTKESGDDYFMFGMALEGACDYEQFSRETSLGPSHFNMIHAGAPYLFRHGQRLSGVCLKIPGSALATRIEEPQALCNRLVPIRPGIPQFLSDTLISLLAQGRAIDDQSSNVLETHILDMVALVLNAGPARKTVNGTSIRWAIYRRALAYITETLHDPDLGPATIAEGLGVSTRYLHRVFQDMGKTVVESVIQMRLDRARTMLREAATAHLSIKEVAFRNGFKSQSHFASAFKSSFGVRPSDLRESSR